MQAQRADGGSVQSMREFLAETLQEVDSFGERLRERVYAFELAEDADFVAKARKLEARLAAGIDKATAMTVDEYRRARGF
ncbi:MAG TPA: hypothetical protein VGR26_17110 [Acidimicrobiales bacterium]|nr:hypothetical protein [Acidimicrobiales bacterium]